MSWCHYVLAGSRNILLIKHTGGQLPILIIYSKYQTTNIDELTHKL